MLTLAANVRIYLHARPTDMRNYAVTVVMRSPRCRTRSRRGSGMSSSLHNRKAVSGGTQHCQQPVGGLEPSGT
jgi:hypothetical protein